MEHPSVPIHVLGLIEGLVSVFQPGVSRFVRMEGRPAPLSRPSGPARESHGLITDFEFQVSPILKAALGQGFENGGLPCL